MALSDKTLVTQLADIAARLKQARLDADLTQQALADLSGVSIKTIGNAEDSGQVSLDTFLRLLDGLGRSDELDAVLLDAGPSPIALASQQGKVRQRVRVRSSTSDDDRSEWEW